MLSGGFNSAIQNRTFEERYFDSAHEEDTGSRINYSGVTALLFASHITGFAKKTSRFLRQPC
jgi:hypothetical protein